MIVKSKTHKTMVAATVAIAAVCWAPQATKAATAVYDDFSADLIDRTKWDRLELVRQVENGVFKSELTRFGAPLGFTPGCLSSAIRLPDQRNSSKTVFFHAEWCLRRKENHRYWSLRRNPIPRLLANPNSFSSRGMSSSKGERPSSAAKSARFAW